MALRKFGHSSRLIKVVSRLSCGAALSLLPARVANAQVVSLAEEMSVAAAGTPSIQIAGPTTQQTAAAQQKPATQKIPARLTTFSQPDGVAASESSIATPQLVAWLERMIRDNLPPTYEDDRKWGQQKEVWDGIKLRREGLRVETERRLKTVNAGTWTKYAIAIVEPEERLFIEFQRLETLPDGRIAFAVAVECSLDVFGRLSQWVRDVQLVSLSANADAAARLTLEGTVKFNLNPLKFPPDVSIQPHVDRAQVELIYYRVRRISQLGGDWAKVLGNGLRKVVDEKLEDMNGKLVDKINKQLAKQSDKLSFSTQDWLRSKLPLPLDPPSAKKTTAAPNAP